MPRLPELLQSPLLEFRGVDTHYGDLHVLKSVDYRIAAGEIVCLLGGNASGKSTTMKAIMGSARPRRGGVRPAEPRRDPLRGPFAEGRQHRRAGAPRHRAGARSAPPFPADDGLREPRDGRLYAAPRARIRRGSGP